MPGANCSLYDCGTNRRTKGIFMVPSAKDDANRRWRDEWIGKINNEKTYTCEKHFDPEETEIC